MSALFKRDISVIIPVYNLERFIQPMLDSLLRQDLGPYTMEIFFVMNNCTDRSEEIIRDSGLDCTILHCTTQGCGPARNAALDRATGNYIWMMDGDDWLLSDTAIMDALDKAYAEDLDILRISYDSEKFQWPYYSMVWQYLLRREYVQDFRFPSCQPGEDDAYMTAVLSTKGFDRYDFQDLPTIDTPLYYYNYMREGSNMYRFSRGEKI